MNKKILCTIPLSFLVVACGHQTLTVIPGCEHRPVDPNEKCSNNRGNGTTPFVIVTPQGWKINPNNVCVQAGDTLEIQFKGPAPKLNTMKTVPHGNSQFWLIGSNSSDTKKITLTVPPGHEKGDAFDYAILSESDGCVDPRITYN